MEAMTAEQAAEDGKDLDFSKVWSALMENREQQRKTGAKMSKEAAGLSRNIGGVNKPLDRWTEQMSAAKLWGKFDAFEEE